MVRIRLRRVGKKHQASYRVVVADIESPRDGKFIENIGFYNPRTDPDTIEIKVERAVYWLSQGAQPSDAALRLLRKSGAMAQFEAIKSGNPPAETQEPEAPQIDQVIDQTGAQEIVDEQTVDEETELEALAEAETADDQKDE